MWNTWLAVAATNGFIAVAAGAFGGHGLKRVASAEQLAVFEVGARYHMYHALALLAVAVLAVKSPTPALTVAGWAFAVGCVLFSGSLYALALTGASKLGMITPLGGTAFLVGWAALFWAAIRTRPLAGSL